MESQITSPAPAGGNAQDGHWRFLFVLLALFLLGVFLAGLYWIFTASSSSPIGTGWFLFSFAAGLSMIVLPCTLPLAFVIVPLSMGKGYVKGLSIALAFGLGVAITLSLYGVLAAVLGKAIFSFAGAGGSIELTKNIFYTIAGVFAMVFALGELGFVKARMPSYMGAAPAFIQNRRDIAKAFMLGLFLGNIGIGCPHPATPIILGQIAVTGDIFYGWLLFFVHAIGRIIPLLLLAVLGILGVNATKTLLRHKDSIARATAWGMVFVGAFLFTLGFFSHDWWVASGQHTLLESITREQTFLGLLNTQLGTATAHTHGLEEVAGHAGFFGLPLWLGNWVFVLLTVIPLWWHLAREQNRIHALSEAERAAPLALFQAKRWSVLLLTILLALIFIYILPQWFVSQADDHKDADISQHEMREGMDESMPHSHGEEGMKRMDIVKLPIRGPKDRIALLPFEMKNGVKEFRLTADEFRWEYAKGKFVRAWGYNGQVPGPEIRVTQGDKVRVMLENRLPAATSLHWHGMTVPNTQDGVPGVTQKSIKPGETYAYEFTVDDAGTRFYHTHGSGHGDEAAQFDMGLVGAFIIDHLSEGKTVELAPDKDVTLLLDEWAVAENGENIAGMMSHAGGAGHAAINYNVFTINGRAFPDTEPIMVKEGEKVRIRMINAGASAIHPMHLHGHESRIVALDGLAVQPSAQVSRYTVTVHPGESYDIEFTADNPGIWVFHCHELHHAGAGMIVPVAYEGYVPSPQ